MTKKSKTMTAGSNWMIPVSSVQQSVVSQPAATAPISPPPIPQVQYPNYVPAQTGGLDGLSTVIMTMNSNPYLIGMFMLLLNLGGRFLSLELTKKQEAFLQSPWLRPLLFFTVIFIATRNLVAAFWVTILFFFIIWVVANEHSSFCLIPSWCDAAVEEERDTYTQNVKALTGKN
jgi:hypothetical protein